MPNLISAGQMELVRRFKQLYSRYQRARDLLAVGAYARGSDPLLDMAIALYPQMEQFLQQQIEERATTEDGVGRLAALFG